MKLDIKYNAMTLNIHRIDEMFSKSYHGLAMCRPLYNIFW